MKKIILLFLTAVAISGYSQIPENLPLFFESGTESTVQQWEETVRPQILKTFSDEVYGNIPADFDPKVSFKVVEKKHKVLDGLAYRKQVIVKLETDDGKSLEINLLIYLPEKQKAKAPVFLGLNFYGNHTIHSDPAIILHNSWTRNNSDMGITDNKAVDQSRGMRTNRWQVEEILSRGYGIATIYYGDIDPDFDDGAMNGLHELIYSGERKREALTDAGSIAVWAYGLSKALDYFETDKDIDHEKVAVIGHSRLGKTSLWAGATDERFALVISNCSGCGGAALSMRKEGETIKKINDRFPHWFCDNYKKYNDKEENSPVDQHMLLALMAPRPIYVASAVKDEWADPTGEQLSAYLSTEIYDLYHLKTFMKKEKVEAESAIKKGFVGYHLRDGKHDITAYDWDQYMDFADIHFEK